MIIQTFYEMPCTKKSFSFQFCFRFHFFVQCINVSHRLEIRAYSGLSFNLMWTYRYEQFVWIFQRPISSSHFPDFPFKFLASFLFILTGITNSGISVVKKFLIIFNKCLEDIIFLTKFE